MKIAVNTRLLLKDRLEGIGWFAFETLRRICRSHPEHEFIFFFDRPWDKSFVFEDNVQPVVLHPQARHPVLYYIWFELSMRKALKKYKADLFLSPDGYLSLSSKIPSIAVFHDLNFEHYPKDLPLAERIFYRTYFPRYARKAKRIATVSSYSRADIVKQYGVDEGKIDVVYNGANESFAPISQEQQQKAREEFTAGKPYFLFVGALHPRKNIANLFRAFDQYHQNGDHEEQLLIVGNKKWWTDEIRQTYSEMTHKDKVVFAGRLSAEKLHVAMASAYALTYVSYFEGFGIPIVEAFRCGTPVITANVTSMPEVAGDAALLCDPFKPESICSAMQKLSSDDTLRNHLIEKGNQRKMQFSWEKSASRLWDTIDSVLKEMK